MLKKIIRKFNHTHSQGILNTTELEKILENKSRKLVQKLETILELTKSSLFYTVLTIVAVLVVFLSSIYTGIHSTHIQSVTSDQFITTYNFSDSGQPSVDIAHTNILKAPLLFLQGKLSYNYSSVALLNIIFVFFSIILWAVLSAKVFGKKFFILICLAFSAILINSTSLAINLTMSTIRHIEYPIALVIIISLFSLLNRQKSYTASVIITSFLIGLLVLHDIFFLYTLVPAGIATMLWLLHKRKVKIKSVLIVSAALVLGSAISKILALLVNSLGLIRIVDGYVDQRSFISFDRLPDAILLSIQQTIDLFGGLFLGHTVTKGSLGLVGGMLVLFITLYGVIYFLKNTDRLPFDRKYFTLSFLFFLASTVYIAYILPDFTHESSARYLTLLPYIGVVFFAWIIIRISDTKYQYLFIVTCLTLVCISVLGFPRSYASYRKTIDNHSTYSEQQAKNIANVLIEQNVQVLGTIGSYQSIRFWSNDKVDSVFEVWQDCVTPVPWINNSTWLKDKGASRTAFLIDEQAPQRAKCDELVVSKRFGKPSKRIELEAGLHAWKVPIVLYIYDYDIRSKLRPAE